MPQSSHKTMKKNNMIKSTKKKETMKKTFEISVAQFHPWIKNENLKATRLKVIVKDWIDAIIEHDKVIKNNCDIKSYLIIGDGKVSYTQLK